LPKIISLGFVRILVDTEPRPVPSNLLKSRFGFTEQGERLHLVQRFLLADFTQGKPDVDQDPVSGRRFLFFQKTKIDAAANACDINERGLLRVSFGKDFHNFSRDG
jgi:hypothetical protein